jgi:predicted TIM-barrel fold metal-dependent hydrolase
MTIQVQKRSGNREPLNIDKWQSQITKICAGIVGHTNLLTGAHASDVLEAHIRAGGGRFRGVRHSCGYDADPIIGNSAPDIQPGLYLRDDFRAGMKCLTDLGLSLDAWGFHPQMPDITDLARAFPSTNIIVGHCGGPLGYGRYAGKQDEVFADWKRTAIEPWPISASSKARCEKRAPTCLR